MTRVGIMQGRLLPPFEGRFQAFPAGQWQEEFPLAREAGLDCIEWIYEKPNEAQNPLGSDRGLAELKRTMEETGIRVRSICADYYMQERLIDTNGAVEHLHWLMGRAALLPVVYMVLPFVDSSSLSTADQRHGLVELMRDAGAKAAGLGLELHLETDLAPAPFKALLDAIDNPAVRMNYDIGNSASLGYGAEEELALLGPHLGSVHIKDRLKGGGTVPLGEGNADFPASFRMIRRAGFERPFILQAARGEDGGETALARKNRLFVEGQMTSAS